MAASSAADHPATERARMRALRAERLARLHAQPAPRTSRPEAPFGGLPRGAQDDAALAEFLGALTAGRTPLPVPPTPPAAVLHFHRPPAFVAEAAPAAAAPAPVCDLDGLAGIGPDLIWALTRVGVTGQAGLARLEAADLAARLGPIGRLAPVAAWIAEARAATGA